MEPSEASPAGREDESSEEKSTLSVLVNRNSHATLDGLEPGFFARVNHSRAELFYAHENGSVSGPLPVPEPNDLYKALADESYESDRYTIVEKEGLTIIFDGEPSEIPWLSTDNPEAIREALSRVLDEDGELDRNHESQVKTVSFRAPTSLIDDLDQVLDGEDTTRSEFLREACCEKISSTHSHSHPAEKRSAAGVLSRSALDALERDEPRTAEILLRSHHELLEIASKQEEDR